jgi:hypothetical protein
MGLVKYDLQMLLYAAEKGVDFKNTLMVGRQSCLMTFHEMEKILKAYDPSISESELQTLEEELERSRLAPQGFPYAEAIFKYLAGGGGV